MGPTNQHLRPAPPAPAYAGDPYGHHEISEPNFSATRPCSGCAPVIQMTATGWLDISTGVATSSTAGPTSPQPVTAIPAGATPSAVPTSTAIDPAPDAAHSVMGGSCTFAPGQTNIIDDVAIAIQLSEGGTEDVIRTVTIRLQSDQTRSINTPISTPPAPHPPILSIGTATLMPNTQTQYVVAGQTLVPGGKPLTISNTTLSLAPSATALVVNGETSSISPVFGDIYTKAVPAALTYNNHVYTVDRTGYIVMGPGTTLIPGGKPVIINGTMLSLAHSGTAVVIQSTTKTPDLVTTIVTLTKDQGALETGCGMSIQSTGNVYVYSTASPLSAGGIRSYDSVPEGWLGGVILLIWCGIGTFVLRI